MGQISLIIVDKVPIDNPLDIGNVLFQSWIFFRIASVMGTTIFECAVTPRSCWLVQLEVPCIPLDVPFVLKPNSIGLHIQKMRNSLFRDQECILISTIILPGVQLLVADTNPVVVVVSFILYHEHSKTSVHACS